MTKLATGVHIRELTLQMIWCYPGVFLVDVIAEKERLNQIAVEVCTAQSFELNAKYGVCGN